MLFLKHEPKSTKEFAGSKDKLRAILAWLNNWQKKKALLIHGPAGVGKSLGIKLIASELGLELVESYASDNRSSAFIKETLLKAAKQKSMFYKGKILAVDDAEALDSARPIAELIEKSEYPVVIIAGDAYSKNLRPLHKYCTLLRFDKIDNESIESRLKKICLLENIGADAMTIKHIASLCSGDMRAALIDLESLSNEKRDYEENIFSVIRKIFKTKSIAKASEAAEKSGDDVIAWLQENIVNEYKDVADIALAYDYLSKADLFSSRIAKRQSWNLQKFSFVLGVAGVAMSKKRIYLGYNKYRPPSRLYYDEKTLQKIGAALRISRKKARQYTQLISALVRKKPEIAEKFFFDENDLEFLGII